MGKTYREMMDSIMQEYDRAWERAFEEFERFGSITDEADDLLSQIECRMALMEL